MIGRLTGILDFKSPPHLLIEVSGIGYELQAPMSTFYHLPEVGQRVTLLTHLQIKEDAHVLFGFYEEQERRFFRALIKVSGVGPKMALTILSGIQAPAFMQCIERKETGPLVRLPGVGQKTAERLIIEMAGKLEVKFLEENFENTSFDAVQTKNSIQKEAISALISLGYKPSEASKMIFKVQDDAEATSSQDLIRKALQSLSKV